MCWEDHFFIEILSEIWEERGDDPSLIVVWAVKRFLLLTKVDIYFVADYGWHFFDRKYDVQASSSQTNTKTLTMPKEKFVLNRVQIYFHRKYKEQSQYLPIPKKEVHEDGEKIWRTLFALLATWQYNTKYADFHHRQLNK